MQRFWIAFVFAMCVLVSSGSTMAAGKGCLDGEEYEAEQGLRIHSELMVIGLTCEKMPEWPGIYADYKRFTLKNEQLIGGYENRMIQLFRQDGLSKPDKELHNLRTRLANNLSRQAITMSTKTFCDTYGSRVKQALAMDSGKVRQWAQQVWADNPTSQPMCSKL